MRMNAWFAALAAVFTALAPAAAQTPASPQGNWITASGNLEIAIAPCGRVLCGTVVRVLANNSMAAPGATSQAAPLALGFQLVTELRRDGDAYRGRIFNRENNQTYDCVVRPLANGQLEVRPYVVLPLFGRTQIWRRPAPTSASR